MYKMDNLIEKQNELKLKLQKYKNKISSIEDKIYDIEVKISSFDNEKILNDIKLNDMQKEIVKSDCKNMLVVAVPGSGKTHTLISRYIDIVLNKNVNPESIILITFTKKSGQEMYERINKILPNKSPYYVGSLHGLGFKMLNKDNYSILDERESYELLIEIAESITKNSYIIKNINNIYDRLSISDNSDLNNILEENNINKKFKKTIEQIFLKYENIKNNQMLLDFNDLMIRLNEFLDTNNGIKFRENIKYIFFDEFQDINPIQNSILEKFKEKSNIMVVGDDSQSIYSFRGSSVDYILNYEYDKCFYLQENYRSSPYIINLFDNIIDNNIKKLKKNIKSSKKENGVKPLVKNFSSNEEQYEWIAEQIKDKYNNGVKLKDIAVLSRIKNSLNSLELHLKKKDILYTRNSLSILNKEHIKELLAFVSLIYNNKNSISIKRILKLHKIDYNKDISKDISIELFKYNNELNDFYNNLITSEDTKKIQLLRSYMVKFYPNEKSDINVIINFFKNYNDLKQSYYDLYVNIEIEDNNDDKLFLSTIHSSKGLEWKHVYIIDCSNEKIPCIRPSFYKDEISSYEEERRLFYVASSRAKDFLNFTYSGEISPFIKELDPNNYISHIDISNKVKNISNIKDIKNKLKYDGYNFCMEKLFNSSFKEIRINNKLNLNIEPNIYVNEFLLNVFKKILINNFKNVKLENSYTNLDENTLLNYKDPIIGIKDSLKTIKYITDTNICKKNEEITNVLIKLNYSYYEKEIVKYFKNSKKITINNDNIIIDNNFYLIQSSSKNTCDVFNVLKADFLSKKNKINIYSPFTGLLFKINILE